MAWVLKSGELTVTYAVKDSGHYYFMLPVLRVTVKFVDGQLIICVVLGGGKC